jgi:glucose-1-phosphate thymidylyltransferase
MAEVTGGIPKALIKLGGITILDRLLQKLAELEVDVHLVTNDLFLSQFRSWYDESSGSLAMISDGSTSVDNRLGATGDLAFAITNFGFKDDLLVVAADNVLNFSMKGMQAEFFRYREVLLAIRRNSSLEDQTRRGVVELAPGGIIRQFQEKPDNPTSLMMAAPLYMIPKELLPEIDHYLAIGGNPDAPGYLMEYLVDNHTVRGWQIPGEIVDVGNLASYSQALQRFT